MRLQLTGQGEQMRMVVIKTCAGYETWVWFLGALVRLEEYQEASRNELELLLDRHREMEFAKQYDLLIENLELP